MLVCAVALHLGSLPGCLRNIPCWLQMMLFFGLPNRAGSPEKRTTFPSHESCVLQCCFCSVMPTGCCSQSASCVRRCRYLGAHGSDRREGEQQRKSHRMVWDTDLAKMCATKKRSSSINANCSSNPTVQNCSGGRPGVPVTT